MKKMLGCVVVLIMASGGGPLWAEEDEWENRRAEMKDFLGGVYRGGGQYTLAGSTASGRDGTIVRAGSVWETPEGQYQKVGSVYLTPDGGIVTRAGSAFIDRDDIRVKAGSAYVGKDGITTSAGGVVIKPGWSSR